MKKIMILLVAILGFAASSKAQDDSKMAAGLNFNVGVGDSYTNFGLGAKYQYRFANHWRGEASFNYYFKKDFVNMWDFNLDAHYLIPVKGVTIYPLAGLTLRGTKLTVEFGDEDFYIGSMSASETNIGINYGAGVEFPVTDAIKLNFEAKGVTCGGGWGTRGVFSIGAAYCF